MTHDYTASTLKFRDDLKYTLRLDRANADLDDMMSKTCAVLDELDDLPQLGDWDEDHPFERPGDDIKGAAPLFGGENQSIEIDEDHDFGMAYAYGTATDKRRMDYNLAEQREQERTSQERRWWWW